MSEKLPRLVSIRGILEGGEHYLQSSVFSLSAAGLKQEKVSEKIQWGQGVWVAEESFGVRTVRLQEALVAIAQQSSPSGNAVFKSYVTYDGFEWQEGGSLDFNDSFGFGSYGYARDTHTAVGPNNELLFYSTFVFGQKGVLPAFVSRDSGLSWQACLLFGPQKLPQSGSAWSRTDFAIFGAPDGWAAFWDRQWDTGEAAQYFTSTDLATWSAASTRPQISEKYFPYIEWGVSVKNSGQVVSANGAELFTLKGPVGATFNLANVIGYSDTSAKLLAVPNQMLAISNWKISDYEYRDQVEMIDCGTGAVKWSMDFHQFSAATGFTAQGNHLGFYLIGDDFRKKITPPFWCNVSGAQEILVG